MEILQHFNKQNLLAAPWIFFKLDLFAVVTLRKPVSVQRVFRRELSNLAMDIFF